MRRPVNAPVGRWAQSISLARKRTVHWFIAHQCQWFVSKPDTTGTRPEGKGETVLGELQHFSRLQKSAELPGAGLLQTAEVLRRIKTTEETSRGSRGHICGGPGRGRTSASSAVGYGGRWPGVGPRHSGCRVSGGVFVQYAPARPPRALAMSGAMPQGTTTAVTSATEMTGLLAMRGRPRTHRQAVARRAGQTRCAGP